MFPISRYIVRALSESLGDLVASPSNTLHRGRKSYGLELRKVGERVVQHGKGAERHAVRITVMTHVERGRSWKGGRRWMPLDKPAP